MTRVLVTMRSIRDPATDELRDSLSHDWSDYLDGLEMTSLPIANTLSDPGATVESLSPDAVLLTNGEDLGTFPPRDRTERALIDAAIEATVPVLGVCRGHQILNDYFGGTVVTLDEYRDSSQDAAAAVSAEHGGTEHAVDIRQTPVTGTLPEVLQVNSYHDDGVVIQNLASALEPFAVGTDGTVVEGAFHPSRPILSIQWHPERPLPDRAPVDRLVSSFLRGNLRW